MNFNDLRATQDGALLTLAIAGGPSVSYLDERLLSQLSAALQIAADDPSVGTICLCGQANGFLAGADVGFFVRCLLDNDLDRILRFTRAAHELLAHLGSANKPVVAWVNGPAMGAGLELALACQNIVAGPTAKFALPETSLGIYPGMGGTQRTPRRIGAGLAKWMIYTGSVVPAAQALEIGLVDALHATATPPHEAMESLGETRAPRAPLSAKFAALERLFADTPVASLLDPAITLPADPQQIRAIIQVRNKAPIALRLAEQIIDRGLTLPLADAIEEEFAHLREIFLTEDARAGLLSLGKTQPTFVGR